MVLYGKFIHMHRIVNSIEIDGKEIIFIGQTPLKVCVQNLNLGWLPKTNVWKISSGSSSDDLNSLGECFAYIREKQKSTQYLPYLNAYVFDYKTQTVYYDNSDALLQAKEVLKYEKLNKFFINFVKIKKWVLEESH